MTTDNTYNGWSNYQTWVVNLWLDNDQGTQEMICEMAKECIQSAIDNDESDIRASASYEMSKRLSDMIDELNDQPVTGMFADLLGHAIGMVDFYEIAKTAIDEIEIFSAGWNMPGYMPDNAPAMFCDISDAHMYISEQLDNVAESEDDQAVIDELTQASLGVLKEKGECAFNAGSYHYFITRI